MALHANIRFKSMPTLHDKLLRAADQNGRSLNAEMLARLETSFQAQELKDIVREAFRDVQGRANPCSAQYGHEGFGG